MSFDPVHLGLKSDIHAYVATSLYQTLNEIGIEAHERPAAAMQDRDLRTGPSGHMRKLEGNVAASDEYNMRRQFVQIQELLAGREVFLAWNGKFHGLCAGGDHDVSAF